MSSFLHQGNNSPNEVKWVLKTNFLEKPFSFSELMSLRVNDSTCIWPSVSPLRFKEEFLLVACKEES